ncbi:uncharacterized protein LOC119070329 [Bradysia coprophila]|uniref:uncharacterized protein LOC119070329 n=1 Tax=Bradysia coprophila TaxID=38358 RepID=UPI00187DD030|nr:uncharacterized protein LOC119070329 [Bradysia coprophila]XP_037030494.1 uncharacterized protein LOC119070329 [Bradysia coprophila]
MERQDNKTPSISPTPDSDSTNLSVETIINNNATHESSKNQPAAAKPLNTSSTVQMPDGDAQHLYNIPDLVTNPKKDKEVFSTETIVSQNPNINNASASSSVTLITGPTKSHLPITIWLAIVQLLLSIALTTLGGLVLARGATLSQTGSGIWAGGIAAIAGALGVINVRKAQTGFLAVSLICVASSTLAIALTGIGLVRDLNLENSHGAIAASSGLILTLSMHLIISVLSVYNSAMRLCSRSKSNGQMVENVLSNQNSTYLSQQRIEQYFKSLHESNGKQMFYPTLMQKNGGKSGSEKYSMGESVMPYWLPQMQKKHSVSTLPHHRPMVLVPAGVGNGISMVPLYPPPMMPPMHPPQMLYPPMPPGVILPHPYPIPMRYSPEVEEKLERIRVARSKERRSERERRKSESDMEIRKALTYTGLDRAIAESFLEQQERTNGSNIDCTSLNERGRCEDVAM